VCGTLAGKQSAIVDHYSLLDHRASPPDAKGKLSKKRGRKTEVPEICKVTTSQVTGEDKARVEKPQTPPRFPGEDAGISLSDMARADLDAALQLLADRAQYITGASGAAIALRRGGHHDMLCRARVGSNAPELGSLLSMEYGLSGESVRTRQLLRCNDAERDPRVNRALCRELGIASVLVMPISREAEVFGIFELFAGKPNAFNDRDLSALTRLAEMVVTAVKQSGGAHEAIAPAVAPVKLASEQAVVAKEVENGRPEPRASVSNVEVQPAAQPRQEGSPAKSGTSDSPKKPLFWSAASQAQASVPPLPAENSAAVPPVLRNLRKCQECGFPISQGRTFCVECEEKQWHGRAPAQAAIDGSVAQPRAQTESVGGQPAEVIFVRDSVPPVPTVETPRVPALAMAAAASAAGGSVSPLLRVGSPVENVVSPDLPLTSASAAPTEGETGVPANPPEVNTTAPFLSSAVPSESWLSANKYVLLALLAVALVIVAIAEFH
jgi:hypothetical protein